MEMYCEGASMNIKANYALQIPFKSKFPIITEILRHHPIYRALTAGAVVPERYVFELWNTIRFEKASKRRKTPEHFIFHIASCETKLYLDEFRNIIGFPEQGDEEFEELPSVEDMLSGVHALGYDGELIAMKDFKRQCVASLWHPLYNIISHCLMPAQKGSDSMNKHTLAYYYAITHNVKCDFAKLAWEKLIQVVKGKDLQDRKYIPYIRFFTLLVQDAVESNENIPEIEDAFTCFIPMFTSNMRSTGSERVKPFPIPPFLLNLVPEGNPHLGEYKEWLAAGMGSASRQTPTQTAHRSPGEGPSQSKRKRGDRGEGDSGIKHKRRKLRKVRIVEEQENIEAVQDSTPEIQTDTPSTQPSSQSTQPSSQSTQPSSQSTQTPPTTQTTESTPPTPLPSITTPTPPTLTTPTSQTVYSPSPLASASPNIAEILHSASVPLPGHHIKSRGRKFKRMAAPTGVLKVLKRKSKRRSESSSDQRPVEPETEEFQEVFGDLPEFTDAQVTSTIQSVTSEIEREHEGTVEEDVLEKQGRTEGDVVEKQREDERSGLGLGQKENVSPPLVETNESSREQPRVEDENFPISHAQTSPRYSDSSQQEPVSQIHGDIPHMPRSPHLEDERVESREDQPHPSTSFGALESRSPLRDTNEQAQLSTEAGTSREGLTSCDLQRTLGSPTLAYDMPAFDVGTGSQVPPETGSTGNLCDPGKVRVTHPDSGCKANESTTPIVPYSSSSSSSDSSSSSLYIASVSSKENQEAVLRKIQIKKSSGKSIASVERPTAYGLPLVTNDTILLPMLPFSSDFLEPVSSTPITIPQQNPESSSPSSSSSSSSSSSDSQPSSIIPQRPPTHPDIPSTSQTQSKDELCQLLVAILRSETNLNVYDRGVLNALELRTQGLEREREVVELKEKLESQKLDNDNKLAEFERRLLALESCRPASISVRRDDPDSDDHPEGENQREGQTGQIQNEQFLARESGDVQQDVDVGSTENVEAQEVERVSIQRMNTLWKEVKQRGLVEESVDEINKRCEDVFGDDFYEVALVETDSESEGEHVSSTQISHAQASSSSQTQVISSPLQADFQSFDVLRNTPEASRDQLDKTTFKRIIQEAFQSPEVQPDNFPTEWTEEQRRFINRGYFFADKKRMIELGVKPKEAAKKIRFLEERAYKIFCGPTRVTTCAGPEKLSMFKFKQTHERAEYEELLSEADMLQGKSLKKQIKHRIQSLLNVKLIRKVSISVPTFFVKRMDGEKYRFHEAQFSVLPVDDIVFLYNFFRETHIRPFESKVGFEAVKRYMSSRIQHASLEDFQIGFEMMKSKINVPYPNQFLSSEDIDNLPIGHVKKEPIPGVVFLNSQNKKIFIDFEDLAAYSDGTLEFCKNVLSCLKEEEDDKSKKELFDFSITKINSRLVFREDIRKLRNAKNVKQSENVIRRKGGCWIRYAPDHKLGPHNQPPPDFEENTVVPEDKPEGDNWFWHPNKSRYKPKG